MNIELLLHTAYYVNTHYFSSLVPTNKYKFNYSVDSCLLFRNFWYTFVCILHISVSKLMVVLIMMNYGKYFKYYRYPLKVCNSYKRIARIPNIDHIITRFEHTPVPMYTIIIYN